MCVFEMTIIKMAFCLISMTCLIITTMATLTQRRSALAPTGLESLKSYIKRLIIEDCSHCTGFGLLDSFNCSSKRRLCEASINAACGFFFLFYFIKSSPRAKRNNRNRERKRGDSECAYKRNKIK